MTRLKNSARRSSLILKSSRFEEQQMIKTGLLDPERSLPFLIQSDSTDGPPENGLLMSWYKDNEPYVDQKLLEHGAILFRGFGVNTPASFARLTRSVVPGLLDCLDDNGPRTKITSGIYTSTEYPPEYQLRSEE